ncbi:unnamed protein product [Urochloa humidicola]
MALPWWLATTACAPPSSSLTDALAFLFLSRCPRRALLGAVDLVFLAACLVLLAHGRLCRRESSALAAAAPEREVLLQEPKPSPPLFRYALALAASSVFAAASVVLLALVLLVQRPTSTPWRAAAEVAFLAAHAAAHGIAAWTVAASGRGGDAPTHVRAFWLATALGAALLSSSAAARGAAGGSLIFPDDVLAFAGILVSLPLAYVAVVGFTAGAGDGEAEAADQNAAATPYAAASFVSRAAFSWINPLISKGHAAAGSLAAADVPGVPRTRCSCPIGRRRRRRGTRWPPGCGSPSGRSSRSPWRSASRTSRPCTSARRSSTGSSGSSAAAAMGGPPPRPPPPRRESRADAGVAPLQLPVPAPGNAHPRRAPDGAVPQVAAPRRRRPHGAGAMVNYVQVDAAMVSSAVCSLHGLWLMPAQVAAALLLLYAQLDAAVLSTLAVIAAVTVITAVANRFSLEYKLRNIGARDRRIRALAEMLAHMRVVKLQAWEETLGGKVREIRREELGWLLKFTLLLCANNVVFSSCPLDILALRNTKHFIHAWLRL